MTPFGAVKTYILHSSPSWLEFSSLLQGGNSWGGWGGGGLWPPNFWPTSLFSGFSHTTDRKVPSEVVLMGYFMSVMIVMQVRRVMQVRTVMLVRIVMQVRTVMLVRRVMQVRTVMLVRRVMQVRTVMLVRRV